MKYFFFLILTVCAETLRMSAQTAKDENFQLLNDVHLTAQKRRVRIFRAYHEVFSIFSKPLTLKFSSNSFCNFQFDKRENFL